MKTLDDLIAELRAEAEQKQREGERYLHEAAAILNACDDVMSSIGRLEETGQIR